MNTLEQKLIDIYNEYKDMSDDETLYSINMAVNLNISKPEDLKDGCVHSLTLELFVLHQSLICTENGEDEDLILEVLDTGEEIVSKYNHEVADYWKNHDRNILIDDSVIQKIKKWEEFCNNNGLDKISWFVGDGNYKVDDIWIYNDAIWLEDWFEEYGIMTA